MTAGLIEKSASRIDGPEVAVTDAREPGPLGESVVTPRPAGFSGRDQVRLGLASSQAATTVEPAGEKGRNAGIELTIPGSNPDSPAVGLRTSLVVLRTAAKTRSLDDWLDAALVLKRTAVDLRQSTLARHAEVLLALADVLTFTDPSDRSLTEDAALALEHGISVLSEPFVSESAEESLLIDLMARGWKLAPAVEVDEFPG